MEYVIEMNHITKQFGNFKANDDITLQVKKARSTRCSVKMEQESQH